MHQFVQYLEKISKIDKKSFQKYLEDVFTKDLPKYNRFNSLQIKNGAFDLGIYFVKLVDQIESEYLKMQHQETKVLSVAKNHD